MPERGFALASEHPRDFLLARLAFHFAQVRESAAPRHLFEMTGPASDRHREQDQRKPNVIQHA